MPDESSEPSQFQWDEAERQLGLRGRQQRRYDAWKIFLPGFVVLAAAVPLGTYVEPARGVLVVAMALVTAVQLFLSLMYALRRVEVEYLWPLEQHVRFDEQTRATYRERARHAQVELDGMALGTGEVREVQLRTIVAPGAEKQEAEVFLVFDDRIILVERSTDHATLREYAAELRERLGLEPESGRPRPITLAPTQLPGCREMWWPLGAAAAVGIATDSLPPMLGPLLVLLGVAVLVGIACVASFWIYRARLRRASHRWVLGEFGLAPRPVLSDGSYRAS